MNSTKMFWTDILEDCINRTKVKNFVKLGKQEIKLKLKNKIEKIISLIKKFCKTNKTSEKINGKLYNSMTEVEPSEDGSLNIENYLGIK